MAPGFSDTKTGGSLADRRRVGRSRAGAWPLRPLELGERRGFHVVVPAARAPMARRCPPRCCRAICRRPSLPSPKRTHVLIDRGSSWRPSNPRGSRRHVGCTGEGCRSRGRRSAGAADGAAAAGPRRRRRASVRLSRLCLQPAARARAAAKMDKTASAARVSLEPETTSVRLRCVRPFYSKTARERQFQTRDVRRQGLHRPRVEKIESAAMAASHRFLFTSGCFTRRGCLRAPMEFPQFRHL